MQCPSSSTNRISRLTCSSSSIEIPRGKSQMSHRSLDSRRAIDACTFQLHTWKPFHLPYAAAKTLPLDSAAAADSSPKPYYSKAALGKRPCLSDRATTSFSIDISPLSLIDDDRSVSSGLRFIDQRKRRRRRGGSRSVSGRSSDRSGTQRRGCSVNGGTCSDFPLAAGGTDSSGELFLNGGGEGNWASDVSEAAGKGSRREREERESLVGVGAGQMGHFESVGNVESGYGSEPGYRGDAELGDGDETLDEEEEDQRLLFWGQNMYAGTDTNMEMVGENTLQKTHHRCRRKKNDVRMIDPLR